MNKLLPIIFISFITQSSSAQSFLSNLNATKNDAVYTTYAAPIERSQYKIDQGYHLMWYDAKKGVNLESRDGGNLCLVFKYDGTIRTKLSEFHAEPVITASYSDLVTFYYYPFGHLRVDVSFVVYSSQIAFQEISIKNENSSVMEINIYPYFESAPEPLHDASYHPEFHGFHFPHIILRDNWMKHHDIPLIENVQSVFMLSAAPDSRGMYAIDSDTTTPAFFDDIKNEHLNRQQPESGQDILAFQISRTLQPGESFAFRIIRGVDSAEADLDEFVRECKSVVEIDPTEIIQKNGKLYSKIPQIHFNNPDHDMLYWNAFSLIRQCMMPPEGECSYNYYVFSREPKWGWGYGGQVFHESLVMLAYAFMDPARAMNSQRVYMERQWENGYINYRTGPYLNETIFYNGQHTTSAPWYNNQNLEIYKITGDDDFLKEAYESGKKFYQFYIANRDSDDDGLCEWGGHAELESVRDAKVAVWDSVGWAANFEGLDVNTMLVSEATALAEMAGLLGFTDEQIDWKADADHRAQLIRQTMWDDATGFFYHVDKTDHDFSFKEKDDLKVKEIIGFLPLWAGVASEEQAEKLMTHLTDPDQFWRRFGVPTLSAQDDYYDPLGYWNGPIWVQWQYLLFRGLLDYGYADEARELARRVMDNVIHQLKTDHWFWEFYSADDHRAGWHKTYIWTGIVARMLIDLDTLD